MNKGNNLKGWRECKLGDVVEIVPGFAFKSHHFSENIGDARVIKIKDIIPPFIDISNSNFVDLSSYDKKKLSKYIIKKKDFVVAMTGATIGKVGRMISDEIAYINQRIAIFRPKDITNKDFIYYLINSTDFQAFIINNIDSNSVQENISAGSIGRFPILLPPLPEQRAIASVLSSLDDKIDLLHRQNKTLEAMAEALFRQWFVEPCKNGLPEGWEEGKISQLVSIQNGFAFKSKDFIKDGINRVIKIKNISDGIINIKNTDCIDSSIANQISHQFKIDAGDILIAMTGAEIGKLGIVPPTNNVLWLNQRVGLLKEKYPGSKYLAYLHLKSEVGQDHIINTATGSAQANISAEGIEKCFFPKISEDKIIESSKKIEEIYRKFIFNLAQIRTLEKLRDLLLPKLISGEIRVQYE